MLQILQTFFPSLLAFSLAAQTPPPRPAPKPAEKTAPTAEGKAKSKAKPAAKTKAAAKGTPAQLLVGKVQQFYDSTKDFSADFIQTYTRIALSRTSESRGTVKVLKPGMMRWDYTKPEPKQFIADGTQLFIYDVEEQHVSIDPQFQLNDQSSSLSFLWGKGRLQDEFEVSMGDRTALKVADGLEVLELKPKKDATYSKLFLVIEPATGQVVESILHETTGNLNRFKFDQMKINGGLKPEAFKFTPPPGAEVAIIRR